MFLSRLSDIVEPRHRTEQGSRFFSQLKISYQKIEIFARIVDLLLTGVASIVGRGLCQHVWHENFVTAEVCMGAGLNQRPLIHLCGQRTWPLPTSSAAGAASQF